METLIRAWRQLAHILWRRFHGDLSEEMREHLQEKVEELAANGLPAEEARFEAKRQFGNTLLLREQSRDVWSLRWLETLLQDMRYGLRQLRRNPGLAAVVMITLGLGIGANTAMFSVVNAVLLEPLAYHDPTRIVTLSSVWKHSSDYGPVSAPDFRDWQEQSDAFAAMAYYKTFDTAIVTGEKAEYGRVAMVTSQFLRVFDAGPVAGRGFTLDEEKPGSGGAAVVSLSYAQSHFGSGSAALGHTLEIYGKPLAIVGVLPAGFGFPDQTDIWFPAGAVLPVVESRGGHNYWAIARLKSDVRLKVAQAQMNAVASRLGKQYPSTDKDMGIAITRMRDEMVRNVRRTLYLLLGAVGLVLLIACANVATLLLTRATGRAREIVVRAALGASRVRITRQLITESLLLALLAGGAGLAFAVVSSKALIVLAPGNIPLLGKTAVDGPVLAFTLALSALTSILSGLAPALHASRSDLTEALKQGATRVVRGGTRLHRALVVAEVALAMILLTGTGLLLRSFVELNNVPLGFRPEHVLVMDASVPASGVKGRLRAARFYRGLLDQISGMPGVSAAGATMALPGHACCSGWYRIDRMLRKSGENTPNAVYSVVTPGTFAALGIPFIAGRDFNAGDTADAPLTAVINEALARQAFHNQDPIGPAIFCGLDTDKPMRIVGVVGDVREYGPATNPEPEVYMPYDQHTGAAGTSLSVVVRSTDMPGALAEILRRVVHDRSADVPARFSTLGDSVSRNLDLPRFRALLLSIFAALAVCLAMIGVYGVLAYVVSQRSNEIGLRMALGATKGSVLRLVLRQGLMLVSLGMLIGFGGALVATRLLASMLFKVRPVDPVTYLGTAVFVSAVALAASYLPARRAAKVDPMVALRHE
ncbi:MAG TPA: ABC transporter permease [Terriglobia bacterium]|nr:ABC transporter permease [Terriglobia bacterium]